MLNCSLKNRNESGIIEEELSFDAWGNRRNATDWSFNNLPTSFMFDRGYTGHEQLDVFGLINMNGRMYDPKLGRMLSPDVEVSDAGNTQSYNRYSYCNYNPLMFTDPDGYHPRPSESGDYNSCYGGVLNWSNSLGGKNNSHLFSNGTDFSNFCNAGGDETFGEDQGSGAPSSRDYDNYIKSQSTMRFADWFKWQKELNFKNNVNSGSGYWQQYGYGESEWVSCTYPDGSFRAERANTPVVALKWVSTGGNSTTSGGDGSSLLTGLNWANTVVNTAAYGTSLIGGSAGFLKSTGAFRYYSNAWKGSQYIKTYNLTKLGNGVGKGTSFVGAALGFVRFGISDKSAGDYGALVVSLSSAALTYFPYTKALGIGIGVVDLCGGFDPMYQALDDYQSFCKQTGILIIPIGINKPIIINTK